MKTPISGHTSPETAYLIGDYPYGRTLRCQRKVWLENDPKRGVRFVAQTDNPKNGRWNKPHKSTYIDVAAALYLDAENHVQWEGIGMYTEPEQALAFVQCHGKAAVGADRLLYWAQQKAKLAQAFADGRAHITINGEKQDRSEAELAKDSRNAGIWRQVAELLAP
ncbi:MAG TPA: hypothetical protein VF077_09580 [Nitrospiraceae bacterium]